jgi:hypothetical protein
MLRDSVVAGLVLCAFCVWNLIFLNEFMSRETNRTAWRPPTQTRLPLQQQQQNQHAQEDHSALDIARAKRRQSTATAVCSALRIMASNSSFVYPLSAFRRRWSDFQRALTAPTSYGDCDSLLRAFRNELRRSREPKVHHIGFPKSGTSTFSWMCSVSGLGGNSKTWQMSSPITMKKQNEPPGPHPTRSNATALQRTLIYVHGLLIRERLRYPKGVGWQCLSDNPWDGMWRETDAFFPGSVFAWFWREPKDLFRSSATYFWDQPAFLRAWDLGRSRILRPALTNLTLQCRQRQQDEDWYVDMVHRRRAEVELYFRHTPMDLHIHSLVNETEKLWPVLRNVSRSNRPPPGSRDGSSHKNQRRRLSRAKCRQFCIDCSSMPSYAIE